MIDEVDHLKEPKSKILMHSIYIQNQELFKRKQKFVLVVLKQAFLKSVEFTLLVQDMDYEEGEVVKIRISLPNIHMIKRFSFLKKCRTSGLDEISTI